MEKRFKYIYGPVYSWRLGLSLGIDPLGDNPKICNMDCVYCQLGKTVRFVNERETYVSTDEILAELNEFPVAQFDYLTFSGRGEPTLAKNLGHMIKTLKTVRKERIAVITNAVLLHQKDVRDDVALADCVLLKLDACDEASLKKVDKTMDGISLKAILDGIHQFKAVYKGKLALQMMFIEDNMPYAPQMALLARDIHPDEVEINTPLRLPSDARPLREDELAKIQEHFSGMNVKTVYEIKRKTIEPYSIKDTIRRHGNYTQLR